MSFRKCTMLCSHCHKLSPKVSLLPFVVHTYSYSKLQANSAVLPVCIILLFLEVLYQWNHEICGLFVSFSTWQGTEASCQQPCKYAIFEADYLVSIKPPDDYSLSWHLDCNFMRDSESQIYPSEQLSNPWSIVTMR